MTKEVSEQKIKGWFWLFANKLAEEYPEYKSIFENIIQESYDTDVLWEVLEFANRHLEVDSELCGGIDNLNPTHYLDAMEYGYNEWVN